MKPVKATIQIVCVVLAFAGTAWGEVKEQPAPDTISIAFENPENFTDLEMPRTKDEHARADFVRSISQELKRRVRSYFGEGTQLSLVISDVDLAGWINPARLHEVRVIKSSYPPKMSFRYQITGADGKKIAEGSERLVDLGFIGFAFSQPRHELYRYEREMLKDWLRGVKNTLSS